MILAAHAPSAAQRVHARARRIHPGIVTDPQRPLADLLASLPVLGKQDLARHLAPDLHWLETAVLFSETSGTTGQPLQTPRGADELAWNARNQAAAYRRFLQPGVDRVAILHPSVLSPFVEASSMALRELRIGQVRVYPIPRVCDYARIFEVLARYRITTVMSTPSLASKLLYEFTRLGDGRPPRDLQKLLLTGEELSAPSMANFQRILGPQALVAPFVYGSSEAASLMLGRADGCFDPVLDDFVFELQGLDDKDDDEEEEEEGGRLLVTWLRDGLMPILRYDTGDRFALAPAGPPALRFLGRAVDSPAERRLRARLEEAVYALEQPVYHYEGRFSLAERQLDLSVVPASCDPGLRSALEASLRDHLPSWQARVELNPPSLAFMQFSPSPKLGKLTSC